MTKRTAIISSARQDGAALLTSLLILLVLSLLAVASMQNVSMQERMVSANRDAQIALEGAEQAAREAEELLENNVVTLGNFGVQTGLYNKAEAPSEFSATTWSGDGESIQGTNNGELAEAPRFFIEHIGQVTNQDPVNDLAIGNYGGASSSSPPEGFRIVAWSSGRSGDTSRIIEVFFGKRS